MPTALTSDTQHLCTAHQKCGGANRLRSLEWQRLRDGGPSVDLMSGEPVEQEIG
jgi:hypothetical protein